MRPTAIPLKSWPASGTARSCRRGAQIPHGHDTAAGSRHLSADRFHAHLLGQGPALLAALRKIESRGAHEIAHRIKATCARMFSYAHQQGCQGGRLVSPRGEIYLCPDFVSPTGS
ncbi:hypothetical protein ACFSQU_03515 [Massilia sp. GCM10020059]|uniref:phage integrase central domain-containing protein n=1 Tax=Massilia TaxID=149698 RepID=UPI0035308558